MGEMPEEYAKILKKYEENLDEQIICGFCNQKYTKYLRCCPHCAPGGTHERKA